MRYLSGNQDSEYSVVAEYYVRKYGCTLDRKLYTYYLIYKGDKITDYLPDGIIVYSDYTGYSISMDVYTPRCLTKGVIKQMFHYPFDELEVMDLYGAIESNNEVSAKIFSELGCIKIAEIPNYYGYRNDRMIYWTNRENIARWIN